MHLVAALKNLPPALNAKSGCVMLKSLTRVADTLEVQEYLPMQVTTKSWRCASRLPIEFSLALLDHPTVHSLRAPPAHTHTHTHTLMLRLRDLLL